MDTGSEVSASHRLMEAVGQQAQVDARGEKKTAVYSPVILTLVLIREADSEDSKNFMNNVINEL